MSASRNHLTALMQLLSDGKYHDGTTIGKLLKMTRSGVWKTIQKLEKYGVKISAVKGKGYALQETFILLDKKRIKQQLDAEYKNMDIHLFETLPSTNDYLKKFFNHTTMPIICLSEQQTQGKGRLGRKWHSPFGKGLYFSCLYTFSHDISKLNGLSLVVSLAVIDTFKKYKFPELPSIKWPNDILYKMQKLAGNLIEIKAEAHGVCYAIIGIGINANMNEDKDSLITQAWTSLRTILGCSVDRNELCAILINTLLKYLKQFEQQGLTPFLEKWHPLDYLFNKKIMLREGNQIIEGIAKGINAQGHLLLQGKNRKIKAFSAGDATIVKK